MSSRLALSNVLQLLTVLVACALTFEEERERDAFAFEVETICDACMDVWLHLNPHADGNGESNLYSIIDAPDPVHAAQLCYKAIDRACADCKYLVPDGCTHSAGAVITVWDRHNIADLPPRGQPSSRFAFCREHSANSAVQMSRAAWDRVVRWKLGHCAMPLLQRPPPLSEMAASLGREHESNIWLPVSRYAEHDRQAPRRERLALERQQPHQQVRLDELSHLCAYDEERKRTCSALTTRELDELERLRSELSSSANRLVQLREEEGESDRERQSVSLG